MGHLVTWCPRIRLWAGVLVYETQCPHHSSIVGRRVVGVKVLILICVGGLTVHRGADGVIFFSIKEDVKEGDLGQGQGTLPGLLLHY